MFDNDYKFEMIMVKTGYTGTVRGKIPVVWIKPLEVADDSPAKQPPVGLRMVP